MRRFWVLLALALLTILEVGAWLTIAERFGAGGALGLLLGQAVVGIAIMRWGARSSPADRGWRISGGALIAFPGLLLGLVGVALIIPTSREAIKRAMTRKAEDAMRRSGMSVITVTGDDGSPVTTVVPGDVISGEVVTRPTDRTGAPQDASQSGPRVVRGELHPKDPS